VKRNGTRGNRSWRQDALAAALAGAMLAAGAAQAQESGTGFVAAERAVLGGEAASGWRSALFGGAGRTQDDGNGGQPGEFGAGKRARDADRAPGQSGHLGRKMKAGALSALLPGAGQFYNGKRERAYLMAGVEVGIWTAYFVFDRQGDSRMETSQDWSGIYAGTDGDHADSYWKSVGQYMDSDAYNESRYREARALQEPESGLVGPGDAWQWVNEDRRRGYVKLRADGNSAYVRRDFMILFAVLNRAVSVFDAVVGAGRLADAAQARVFGLDVEIQLNPALADPSARCMVSRGF
jgi:hypothetical protein